MKLIADIVTNPIILSHWKGTVFFSETAPSKPGRNVHDCSIIPLFDLLHHKLPPVDTLACGGSISTTALELALYLEAEPVYTTGLDLSYTDFKTHVNSSPHYDAMYGQGNRFATIETAMLRSISSRRLIRLPDIHEGEALSDFVFSQYARWIEKRRVYRNRIVNCTAQGVALKGLIHAQIETLTHGSVLPDRKTSVEADTGRELKAVEAKAFLETIKESVQGVQQGMQSGDAYASLRNPDHLFHTIFAEAEKRCRDSESLNSYLTLLLSFINRHIDRAARRIEKRTKD